MLQRQKAVLTDVIELYKNSPILWDKRDPYYSKKEHRAQAYRVLLEKYNEAFVDHGLKELKKKLENMRTAWIRERRKVISSRRRGDQPVHVPSLWYYNLLHFLDPYHEDSTAENTDSENTYVFEDNVEYLEPLDSEEESESIEEKPNIARKIEPRKSKIRKHDHHDPLEGSMSSDAGVFSVEAITSTESRSAEAFGNMVGLQLFELDRYQRTIAQKLISDVIFYGRLNQLSDKSCLSGIYTSDAKEGNETGILSILLRQDHNTH